MKRRVITSYKNLSDELMLALKAAYPNGITDHVKKVPAPKPFYAVSLENDDAHYLIKIDVTFEQILEDEEDSEYIDTDLDTEINLIEDDN